MENVQKYISRIIMNTNATWRWSLDKVPPVFRVNFQVKRELIMMTSQVVARAGVTKPFLGSKPGTR